MKPIRQLAFVVNEDKPGAVELARALMAVAKAAGVRPRFAMWMPKIWRRSSRLGRSTKKISSNRPLRSSSGGRASMSLAVATANTGA